MNIHYEMRYEDCEQLLQLFKKQISNLTWEEWLATDKKTRDELMAKAIVESDVYGLFDVEEAYELFYDWIEGLNKENFKDALQEDLTQMIMEWCTKRGARSKTKEV